MAYCANDVYATSELFKKLTKIYLNRSTIILTTDFCVYIYINILTCSKSHYIVYLKLRFISELFMLIKRKNFSYFFIHKLFH